MKGLFGKFLVNDSNYRAINGESSVQRCWEQNGIITGVTLYYNCVP